MSIIIPATQLRPETLRALIEEFVTRDGTRYGHREATVEEMASALERQLKTGEVVIVFDEESGTCTMVAKEQFPSLGRSGEPLPKVAEQSDCG